MAGAALAARKPEVLIGSLAFDVRSSILRAVVISLPSPIIDNDLAHYLEMVS